MPFLAEMHSPNGSPRRQIRFDSCHLQSSPVLLKADTDASSYYMYGPELLSLRRAICSDWSRLSLSASRLEPVESATDGCRLPGYYSREPATVKPAAAEVADESWERESRTRQFSSGADCGHRVTKRKVATETGSKAVYQLQSGSYRKSAASSCCCSHYAATAAAAAAATSVGSSRRLPNGHIVMVEIGTF